MTRRLGLLGLICCGMLFAQERPNIVVIVADDLGWADVSYHGGEIKTPQIDSLAEQGARLERFYVAPICSPTRAGLMTGRYPIRYGAMRAVYPPWRKGGLDVSEVTLAEILGHAGYTHRGVFGKWHLGHSSIKYHPLRRGFTRFVGHFNGAIDYFTHEREGGLDWFHDYEPVREDGYGTDLTARYAAEFIRKRAGGDDPFLCYVPFNAPHSPYQAKPEHLPLYRRLTALPGDWEAEPGQRAKRRQILGAMIASLDEGVGTILNAIDDAGIRENTLVWFFSDNGGVAGIGDNRPLLGAKATAYEGGIRVPAAIRWPGHIRPGSVIDQPIVNVDLLPTLMRTAGVRDHGGKPLDGIDVLDVLTGDTTELDRKVYSYFGQQGPDEEQVTVIDGEWMLVMHLSAFGQDGEESRMELFQISGVGPAQRVRAADHLPVVQRLSREARQFRALQPEDAVPPYAVGREDFKGPAVWTPQDI